jgi:hypothetical protein
MPLAAKKQAATTAIKSALKHLPRTSVSIVLPDYFYGLATFNLFYAVSANAGGDTPAFVI